MAHSKLFERIRRLMKIGSYCEHHGLSAREGLARIEEATRRQAISRRSVLQGAAAVGAAVGLGGTRQAFAQSGPRIAIVGGGMAGLVCADRLRAKGYVAAIYEASSRIGGRVWSERSAFPNQTAEMGGELIDNLHKNMLAYANEFNLLKEDLGKAPGEKRFFIGGQHYTEAEVVDEYRQLTPLFRADLKTTSGAPTFFSHTAGDVALDQLDLATYLDTHAAGLPLVRKVLEQAYLAEYGRELSEQSALNMLYFLHADNSSKFREFGVFSDERYHLVGGNDAIASHLCARLPGPVNLGAELVRLSKNASGQYQLYFRGASTPELADAVVLAIPFTVLRQVQLEASLGLSADKLRCIQTLGYGSNVKTMIGFNGRPWYEQGGNGSLYADLPHLQTTWETNYSRAGASSVLTDYASGTRADSLATTAAGIQQEVGHFLTDFQKAFPNAKQRALRNNGSYVARRGHWVAHPLSRGSYTCYLPGQFTQLAGLEGQSAGALKFAGEHADSFYEWQGFMEGACRSGIAAAAELLSDLRAGRI